MEKRGNERKEIIRKLINRRREIVRRR